eukprot:TRINITY_DN9524_c0_g1_i2.p1 TRINITY_DN9524_c0_g1~~TRINITY_DN9524_c0_g1_i2.p1  ORF type:complete len:293 (-),score=53.63 TRINITY_DN9524_c0_g1_i2:803-1681(-)
MELTMGQTASKAPGGDGDEMETVNWRDASAGTRAYGPTRLYRSSRCYDDQVLERHGIRTVIDLSPSKGGHEVEETMTLSGRPITYHRVNMFTTRIKLLLITKMKTRVAMQAICCPCTGKFGSTESMMGLAVGTDQAAGLGNSLLVGLVIGTMCGIVLFIPWILSVALFSALSFGSQWVYGSAVIWIGCSVVVGFVTLFRVQSYQTWQGFFSMYKLFLRYAMAPFSGALRVLADPDAYPIMVHCVHGKDRTGLFVACAGLLCGASLDEVSRDYGLSGPNLVAARDTGEAEFIH